MRGLSCLQRQCISIAIGLSSRNLALFGLCILSGLLFSAAFGFLSTTPHGLHNANIGAYIAIAIIMFVHGIERYNRHVIDQAPFLEFHMNASVPPAVQS